MFLEQSAWPPVANADVWLVGWVPMLGIRHVCDSACPFFLSYCFAAAAAAAAAAGAMLLLLLPQVGGVLKLGATVVLTFAVAWYPWTSNSPQAVVQVSSVAPRLIRRQPDHGRGELSDNRVKGLTIKQPKWLLQCQKSFDLI
eukprot:1160492-Pelagomonas_calceolata.AAC.1